MNKRLYITRVVLALLLALLFVQSESHGQSLLKVDSLLSVAKHLQPISPDSALPIAQEALLIAERINYAEGMSNAYMRIGSLYNWLSHNDSAKVYLHKAIALRKNLRYHIGASNALRELSTVFIETGQIDSAFHALYSAHEQSIMSSDSSNIAHTYVDLGNAYMLYGDLSEAKQHFENALAIAERTDMSGIKYVAIDGLANYYISVDESELALPLLLELDSVFAVLDKPISQAQVKSNVALCYTKLEMVDEAVDANRKALYLFDQLGMKRNMAIVCDNLARNFLSLNFPDSVIKYASVALREATVLNDIILQASAHETLTEAYVGANNFRQALVHKSTLLVLRDSIFDNLKAERIAEMQTKYETEKKEQKIALLAEQSKTRTAQRNVLIAGSAALLLCLIVLALVFVQRRNIARKNEIIARQKISSLLNEQEIKTYNAMIEGQEEERKRIAADLHDRLGGMLSTVKLFFNALEPEVERENQQFEKLNTLIDDAVVEVRRISHNLNTGVATSFGLVPAIENLCESIDKNSHLQCTLMVFGMDSRLDNAIEIGIYSMVQEVFNNILKHAKARKVIVQVNKNNNMVTITIEDDGVGFEVAKRRSNLGMGISSLHRRAKRMNGTYHIDSSPGRGTISIIDIPLNEAV